MKKAEYHRLAQKFPKTKVLVVGDIMLDRYIVGSAERISPEAPVPVVLEYTREDFLGGAGNVAANIASLGGRVTLVGVVGNDPEGARVRELCAQWNVTPQLVRDGKRPTSRKTRVLSGHHQLIRVDKEAAGDISKITERQLVETVKRLGDFDVVALSDYAKGSLTKYVVEALKKRFGGKRILANIKPAAKIALYQGVRVVTLNAKEGHHLTNIEPANGSAAARTAQALARLFRASVVLTRGEYGVTVYDRGAKKISHIASPPLHVFDVTGAGDTVIAALALMCGSGARLAEAAHAANRAAGVVVGKKGTSTVTPDELAGRLFA